MIIGKGLYVKKYSVYFKNLPPSFDGFKLIFLSDLHGKEYGLGNEKLLEFIEKAKSDCILIGGDMVVGGEKAKYKEGYSPVSAVSVDKSIYLLEKLAKKHKIIHALGNHEEKLAKPLHETYLEALSGLSVNLLDNTSISLTNENNDKIEIYGLSLGREYYPKFRKVALSKETIVEKIGNKKEDFSILMAHSPTYFNSYVSWGADLTLAGHLHGGIMRLPYIGGVIGPDFYVFPRYDGGLYEKEGKKMIVSCGAGMHTINLRIFNPPEISLIELKAGEK